MLSRSEWSLKPLLPIVIVWQRKRLRFSDCDWSDTISLLKMIQIYLHHFESTPYNLQPACSSYPTTRILGANDPSYRLLFPKTSKKLRTCILDSSKLYFLTTLSFSTGDATTVAYGDDLGNELSFLYMASSPDELIDVTLFWVVMIMLVSSNVTVRT